MPPAPDAGFVPYVLVDRVSYDDATPWPVGDVDGGGLSLQRIAPNLYGNEPLNWIGSAPTPGGDNDVMAPDTDGDGIPDWAEDLMELDRSNAADAGLDADGDGATNLEEFLAGTDHQDSTSNLSLAAVPTAQGVGLMFEVVANKSYTVFFKDSLADAEWKKLADVPASPAGGIVLVPDEPDGNSPRFIGW